MSEEKKAHSRRRKHLRRASYRGNKLLQFVSRYKFHLLTALALLVVLIVMLVLLISELLAPEELLSAVQMMNGM